MSETELIVIEQLPIIKENLRSMSDEIDKEVSLAMSLVCNEETVKSVKDIRAKLTKKYNTLEDLRKSIKTAVLAPYNAFEADYKECVTDKFKSADTNLKGKIDDVENGLKEEKAAEVILYFTEYAQSKNIDFVTFERTGMQVRLSDSLKSLKSDAKAFLDKISDDLALIDTQDNKVEILVEYKSGLNVSLAITTVKNRYARIEEERERQETLQALKAKEHPRIAEVEVLSAPVVVSVPVEKKRYTAKFTVFATIEELQDLKEYLDNGGYKYESN